jgi:hypothetical protein
MAPLVAYLCLGLACMDFCRYAMVSWAGTVCFGGAPAVAARWTCIVSILTACKHCTSAIHRCHSQPAPRSQGNQHWHQLQAIGLPVGTHRLL